MRRPQVVRAEGDKGLRFTAVMVGEHLAHGGGEIVVAQSVGDATNEAKGVHVAEEEGLLTLGGEGHRKRTARETEAQDEELDGEALAGDDGDRIAPVDLGVLARVELEREEAARARLAPVYGAEVATQASGAASPLLH